jgi:hypothetical protein
MHRQDAAGVAERECAAPRQHQARPLLEQLAAENDLQPRDLRADRRL